MSLTTHLLFGTKTQLPKGKARVCLSEDYRDNAASLRAIKAAMKYPFDHMKDKSEMNACAILECIESGCRTQPEIRKATGVSQGTVSNQLSKLISTGLVVANRNDWPFTYKKAA